MTKSPRRATSCLLIAEFPELFYLAVHKGGMQIGIEQKHAIQDILQSIPEQLQFIGLAYNVGHLCVGEHTTAVGYRRALHAHNVSLGPAQIEHKIRALLNLFNSTGDIGVELFGRNLISAGVASMEHQRRERGVPVRLVVRQRPHLTKGPINKSSIPAHPSAEKFKAAMVDALTAAEQFASRKSEIAKAGTLTEIGQRQALRDELAGKFGRAVARAADPVRKAQRELKARRAALVVKGTDKSDIAGALQGQEIRAWFRGLDPMARQTIALTTKDARILTALVSAPPELSGFAELPEHVAGEVEQRYLKLTYGLEVAEIQAAEAVIAEADAAVQIARNDLQATADFDQRSFEAIMAPIEQGVGRPYLVNRPRFDGAEITLVAVPAADGEFDTREASADDLANGVYYKDVSEFRVAQGLAA